MLGRGHHRPAVLWTSCPSSSPAIQGPGRPQERNHPGSPIPPTPSLQRGLGLPSRAHPTRDSQRQRRRSSPRCCPAPRSRPAGPCEPALWRAGPATAATPARGGQLGGARWRGVRGRACSPQLPAPASDTVIAWKIRHTIATVPQPRIIKSGDGLPVQQAPGPHVLLACATSRPNTKLTPRGLGHQPSTLGDGSAHSRSVSRPSPHGFTS